MTAPSHAARIWTVGDELHIEFPSTKTERVHAVTVPGTEAGLKVALGILRARSASSTVGTVGAPTKLQVQKNLEELAQKFIKSGGKVKQPAQAFSPELRLSARGVLREMGLI